MSRTQSKKRDASSKSELETAAYEHEWKSAGKSVGENRNQWMRDRWRFNRRHRKPDDRIVATRGITGACPEGSTYQCTAIRKTTGLRCRSWALRGHTKCVKHVRGGYRKSKPSIGGENYYARKIPVVYSKYLSERLLSRVADAAGARDRFDLSQEMDLMRAAAVDAVELYDATLQLDDKDVNAASTRHAAGLIMREALQCVGDMVEQASKIESQRTDRVSVTSLRVIVNQIVVMAYETFGDEHVQLVKQFADKLQEIRLPEEGATGTTITPEQLDEQVLEMDSTIPIANGEET